MFNTLEIMRMAQGLAQHASTRQSVIAQNIAHADTPGYRSKDIASFAESYRAADMDNAPRRTRAGHFPGDQSGAGTMQAFDAPGQIKPNGNTVSVEGELVKTTELRHQHEMALAVYKSTLGVLRTSLGRR